MMLIHRINLKNNSIKTKEITLDSQYYLLGGRGLTSQIILDEVDPDCDPLGENNKIIIANGLLTGSSFPCSARASVGAKSPLTNGIKEANVGGRPSMMLALHDIRALILEKTSPILKLILIKNEGITMVSAEEYKGLGNYELHSKLYDKYGKKIGIFSIGPAGEYMMKSASVAANDLEGYPSRHAARGGLGAVMGSKKIKAIVIFPSKNPKFKYHDIKNFKEISKSFTKTLVELKKTLSIYGTASLTKPMSEIGGLPTKNFRNGSYDHADDISGETLHELVISRQGKKQIPCSPTCVIRCSNYIVDENGNHVTSSFEYET
ncbi:MAG: aldehyde ferredoxin oxidoreductase N-terminal domain-containing protein, partial [Promethearchaeota archaeon]